jgi:hypothetical protein
LSSRRSFRACLPLKVSGNLIMIADCVFISPSLWVLQLCAET